ncbi:TIGR03089 family protein [uncultured Rothia sp.]|uniref:TIGR03089 family protein n=1 Tax=uncultured Rothia sp. TaxID=316088 RepID=UPI0032172E1E
MTQNFSQFTNFEQFFTILRRFQTPSLLWYSVPGERVELSGRVLDNWISKSANFLVDECEIESGTTVDVVMGAHWRSVVIALATLRVGATFSSELSGAETVFSFTPEDLKELDVEYPVIVDRGPLSPRFMGKLPAGIVDYCAEVRAHGDVYSGFELPVENNRAFTDISFEEALGAVKKKAALCDSLAEGFSAVQIQAPKTLSATYLIDLLAIMASGRGVVVLDPTLDWDDARVQRILSDERAISLSSWKLSSVPAASSPDRR